MLNLFTSLKFRKLLLGLLLSSLYIPNFYSWIALIFNEWTGTHQYRKSRDAHPPFTLAKLLHTHYPTEKTGFRLDQACGPYLSRRIDVYPCENHVIMGFHVCLLWLLFILASRHINTAEWFSLIVYYFIITKLCLKCFRSRRLNHYKCSIAVVRPWSSKSSETTWTVWCSNHKSYP